MTPAHVSCQRSVAVLLMPPSSWDPGCTCHSPNRQARQETEVMPWLLRPCRSAARHFCSRAASQSPPCVLEGVSRAGKGHPPQGTVRSKNKLACCGTDAAGDPGLLGQRQRTRLLTALQVTWAIVPPHIPGHEAGGSAGAAHTAAPLLLGASSAPGTALSFLPCPSRLSGQTRC